jgi:hypothetical protein
MFILVTTISIWVLLFFQQQTLEHTIRPRDLSWFKLFLSPPIMAILLVYLLCLLWVLFSTTVRQQFYLTAPRRARILNSSLRRIGWMPSLDMSLLVLSFALAIQGWLTGTTASLMIGVILTVGLLFHAGEQWFKTILP